MVIAMGCRWINSVWDLDLSDVKNPSEHRAPTSEPSTIAAAKPHHSFVNGVPETCHVCSFFLFVGCSPEPSHQGL